VGGMFAAGSPWSPKPCPTMRGHSRRLAAVVFHDRQYDAALAGWVSRASAVGDRGKRVRVDVRHRRTACFSVSVDHAPIERARTMAESGALNDEARLHGELFSNARWRAMPSWVFWLALRLVVWIRGRIRYVA